MSNEATEAAIAATAQKVTYGASAATVFGGLTANEIAAFGGLIVAALGLLVQIYYKRKHDRREERYHARRMADQDEARQYGDGGL
jgi:hypothetical protein